MRRTGVVLAVLAVAIAVGVALVKRPDAPETLPALTSGAGLTVPFSDKPVPLPAVVLTALDGQPISSTAWDGKVVLLNFWATWCLPCREEIPMLVALQEYYRDRLVIVGLSIDTRPPDEVRQFAADFGVNYPVAIATPEIEQAFGGVTAVPLTVVVNPAGGIVQRHIGALPAVRTEHEIRLLAGLPTDARAEAVADTGQVLLANAAYATEIPGIDFSGLTAAQKEAALLRLNTDHCSCGCGLTVAQCRINDPSCDVSPGIARAIVDAVRGGAAPPPGGR